MHAKSQLISPLRSHCIRYRIRSDMSRPDTSFSARRDIFPAFFAMTDRQWEPPPLPPGVPARKYRPGRILRAQRHPPPHLQLVLSFFLFS